MPLSSPTCGQLRIPLIFLLTNLSKYLKRRLLPRATLPKISRSSGACHVLLPTLTYSKMPVIDIRLSDSLSLPKHSSSMCTYTSKTSCMDSSYWFRAKLLPNSYVQCSIYNLLSQCTYCISHSVHCLHCIIQFVSRRRRLFTTELKLIDT